MGARTATVYVDYQQRASEFSVGDLAYPLAGGSTDESQAGTVVAVWPGIGQVDIEFPWGSGRYPVEDVQRVTDIASKPPSPEHATVPGGVGTVSVPGGPVSKSAAGMPEPSEALRAARKNNKGVQDALGNAMTALGRAEKLRSRGRDVPAKYRDSVLRRLGELVERAPADVKSDAKRLLAEAKAYFDGLNKSAASVNRVAHAFVKRALYWASKDRTYRGTKVELNGGKYACPKCKAGEDGNPIYLRPTNYKRVDGQSHRLLGCPHCLFLIKQNQIIGDPSYQALEDPAMDDEMTDDVMADWDGTMDQGFDLVRNVKAGEAD
jgi:hypothetical protein